MIRIAQPLIGPEEKEAVLAVLDSGHLAAGRVTRQLEEAFAELVGPGMEAVAVSSGTAALHVALLAHGIAQGDEVITTALSFQATANMVLATGAMPVFVDVRDDCNMDPDLIERAITPRTRAVLPVHLFGRMCDMDAIAGVARRNGLALIEDAAQAHGASWCGKSAGSFGVGCFSLYATKNITAGEGGMLTSSDPDLIARMRLLRSHGETSRYSSAVLGFNYRMTDITSAIALAQLGRLDRFNERRRENARFLSENLRGVIAPPEPSQPGAHVWHLYTVRVPEGRDSLADRLKERGIESGIYYPTPIPDQPLYRSLGYDGEDYPNARTLSREVLSLPVHPGLTRADLEKIVETVNEWSAAQGHGN